MRWFMGPAAGPAPPRLGPHGGPYGPSRCIWRGNQRRRRLFSEAIALSSQDNDDDDDEEHDDGGGRGPLGGFGAPCFVIQRLAVVGPTRTEGAPQRPACPLLCVAFARFRKEDLTSGVVGEQRGPH